MRVSGILERVEGSEFKGCNDEWDNQFQTQQEYEQFTRAWLNECKRILKDNGSFWVIGSMQCIYTIGGIMQDLGYWFINDVIWRKKNPTPNFKGTRLNNSHETLIWATKSSKSKYKFHYKTAKELNNDTVCTTDHENGVRKQLGSVWEIGICQGSERLKDKDGQKLHNTQKPEELLYRIITISSNLNDIILDPFGGTMTTGAVAKRTGRNYIMIERDTKYCEYGAERIEMVRPELGAIEQALYDIKPPRVDLKEMIDSNYFYVDEYFYLKDKKPYAQLLPTGKLLYHEEEIDIHTCAARVKGKNADRINGFDVWYVKRGDKLISIDDIRSQYRKDIYHFASDLKIIDNPINNTIDIEIQQLRLPF
jgi:site-specific DNA-methyltransferase (adenine-specific)